MNISILKSELVAGHPDTGAYDADHVVAAGQINLANRTIVVEKFATVRTLMAELGVSAAHTIMTALETEAVTNAALNRAIGIMKEHAAGGGIDLGHSNTRGFIDQMVSSAVLTAQQGGDVKAIAEETISRAAELGLGVVKPGHVEEARR